MAPAFVSARQAGAFGLLIAVALLLPLLGHRILSPREEAYAAFSWGSGAYPYMQDQIFEKKGDIDLLFIGSSHINSAIDPDYVQQRLSEKLGRPATVISLCWGGAGFDPLYFATKDLLAHRNVHTLVFYDDHKNNTPSEQGWRWTRWGDTATDLAGLPWRFRVAYYYGAVVGMPRNLLDLIKPSLPINLSLTKKISIAHGEFHPSSQWLDLAPALVNDIRSGKEASLPPGVGAKPSAVCIYSDETKSQFDFSGPPAAPLQIYFAKKLISLAKAHGTRLICLNIPVLDDRTKLNIPEGPLWRDCFSSTAALVGISPRKVFSGMSEKEVAELYRNPTHLSQAGQDYFTRLVTPSLIQLYDQP